MKLRNAISCFLILTATLVVNTTDPTGGVTPASAQAAPTLRVRVDFRTLYCKNTTGDEPGNDEPYVKFLRAAPGSAPTLLGIPQKSVGAGEYVWNGDSRKVLWEGNLAPGQTALLIVNVMEDDGSPPRWHEWISGAACGVGILDAARSGGATATDVLRCAGLAGNIIRLLNGDDELGQFTVTVKNDNGVVTKTLHTAGARSQIGGYDEPALSDSGKTIRMRLGQGKEHPQRYQASLQVRQITNMTEDAGGDALTWTVTGRDDAK